MFQNCEGYFAHADSREQDVFIRELIKVVGGEPEWNEGEIFHHSQEAPAKADC